MPYPQIINLLNSTAWAILPEKMKVIMDFLSIRLANQTTVPIKAASPRQYSSPNKKVVVMGMVGTISQRVDMMTEYSGGVSTDSFGKVFDDAVSDPAVKSIIIDVDSPGGSVYGLEGLTTKIRNARSQKRIIAVANSLMASAAYYIGSAATKIIATPGAQVGSIGTIVVHVDQSKAMEDAGLKYTFITAGKYKALGNDSEPLSEEALKYYQGMVDQYYDMFISAVSSGRGISKQKVKEDYGSGKLLSAKDALKVGMIDQIRTFEEVVNAEYRRYQR